MRVLIACEFSGIVRDAFRRRGHDAWSCDLLECEADPQWHIQDDVLKHLNDGWDLMIAHPPCTYLSHAGNVWINKQVGRKLKREEAAKFFIDLFNAPIGKIAIENPPGYMNSHFRLPDQWFHPYHFGEQARKKTCLWLNNLPPLMPPRCGELFGAVVPKSVRFSLTKTRRSGIRPRHWTDMQSGSKARSRTFHGIAEAMADQWGQLPQP